MDTMLFDRKRTLSTEPDSSLRLNQIQTVSIEQRIHSVVGTIDTATMTEIDEAVKLSLGLSNPKSTSNE